MLMKMRITAILTLFAILALASSANGQSLYKVLEVGDEAFESRDYYTAFRCYEAVLKEKERYYQKDRSKRYLMLQYGLAAQRFNYFERADSVYQDIIQQSEAANLQDSVYARATYHLAQTQLVRAENEEDYLTAQATFRKVEDGLIPIIHGNADFRKQYEMGVQAGLENCAFALQQGEWVSRDTLYRIADDQVNSRFSDYAPIWEDSTLYFSSLRYIRKDWRQSTTYSKNLAAEYGDTIKVNELPANQLFNKLNRYTNHRAISADEQWMVFTSCDIRDGDIMCALYKRAQRSDGSWGEPVLLSTVNGAEETFTTTQPAFMKDCDGNEWLYFASDREGGKGGLDIWRCQFNGQTGQTGKPENIGAPVNTPWEEATPFYHALTGQLFFSSDRPGGYGQHDLFRSKWENGQWQNPLNVGAPLNSGYNDMYYFSTDDGSKVLFSSDRPRSMRFLDSLNACCQDIYMMDRIIEREIHVELEQCEEKPNGVQGTRVVVEDVTICGDYSTVIDTTINSTMGSIVLPAKRFRKYEVRVATAGLPEQDSVALVDLSADEYEEQMVANVAFEQYPDFIELKFMPDPPRPDSTVLDPFISEELIAEFRNLNIAKPFVRYSDGSMMTPVVPDSNIYRLPYEEPVDIGAVVDSNRRQIDLGYIYNLYSVEVEGVTYPRQICEKVCRAAVYVPLVAKVNFSANIYFDNDKPERSPRGFISVTEQTLENATANYLEREWRFTDPTNFKSQRTNQNQSGPGRGDALRDRIKNITTAEDAKQAARDFFDREVESGLGELTDLGVELLKALKRINNGQRIEVSIQGICSTHGSTNYNDSLAVRRIQCITEFLQDVKIDDNNDDVPDRRLGDYLDTSELDRLQKRQPRGEGLPISIIPLASGEPEGTIPYFEDMLINTRFSVAAASDRKVEISVSVVEQAPPTISVFDLGDGCVPTSAQNGGLSLQKPEQ
jgi:hypothetical protein